MDMPLPGQKNYFTSSTDTFSGFKYREDGKEVIEPIIQRLRGGIEKDKYGKVIYNDAYRLMNEQGISRIVFFLSGIVNKNTHLTKFNNEVAILIQMKAYSKELCITLGEKRREWEVKDVDFVQTTIENTIFTSLLRGTAGFEAELSAKSHHVMENINQNPSGQPGVMGAIRSIFSRGGNNYG